MALKPMTITFKGTSQVETELHEFLSGKTSHGAYIKDVLIAAMRHEKNGLSAALAAAGTITPPAAATAQETPKEAAAVGAKSLAAFAKRA